MFPGLISITQDRFLRWAARTAIEHQPLETWLDRVFSEPSPSRQVEAILAAARVGGVCPAHRKAESPQVDVSFEIVC